MKKIQYLLVSLLSLVLVSAHLSAQNTVTVRGQVKDTDGEPVAGMRWSLFWDSIPFCDLLYVRDGDRKKGFGRKLMAHWEREMGRAGYGLVMTSTQADEEAQHFYRSLGYKDCGGLILPFPGYEQPLELIMAKTTGEGT